MQWLHWLEPGQVRTRHHRHHHHHHCRALGRSMSGREAGRSARVLRSTCLMAGVAVAHHWSARGRKSVAGAALLASSSRSPWPPPPPLSRHPQERGQVEGDTCTPPRMPSAPCSSARARSSCPVLPPPPAEEEARPVHPSSSFDTQSVPGPAPLPAGIAGRVRVARRGRGGSARRPG